MNTNEYNSSVLMSFATQGQNSKMMDKDAAPALEESS